MGEEFGGTWIHVYVWLRPFSVHLKFPQHFQLALLLLLLLFSHYVMSDSLWPYGPLAHQAPLSMGFSRQEYWSRLPFPSPGDLPNPGIKPTFLALAGRFFTTEFSGKVKGEGEVAHSCPTLCDPMDCSLPGFSIHGILQARILEWVTISFSRGSSRPRDQTWVSGIGGRHFNLWATREAPLIGSTPKQNKKFRVWKK